jgi:hypothetical protein
VFDGYFCGKGKNMQEADTWRELLATIISDNKEKQRITEELEITPITLTRWINGESAPRPQNLRHLLTILPQYREQLVQLLQEEKGIGDLSQFFPEESEKDIPAEFYARIFTARASTTEHLRFWSSCNLILQQAIGQIDPNRQGICLWVVRCMPPSGPHNKVRSLRESVGLATPPWGGNLEQQALFLGAESLAGNVVTQCRPGIIENLDEEHHLMPAQHDEFEKSSAIYPILYAGRVAGVFMVSSTQYNYFVSQSRTSLLQKYADLLALAFEPEDFYAPEQVALHVMPYLAEQRLHFAKFRQLIADTMIDAANSNRPTNNIQADWKVWQRLEEELLEYAARQRVL